MTTYERNAIRERIYPAACRGASWALRALSNLTTERRKKSACLCGCGHKVPIKGNVFSTQLCHQRWLRAWRKRQPLSERQKNVLYLRARGFGWTHIGKIVGYTSSSAAIHCHAAALEKLKTIRSLYGKNGAIKGS